VSELLTGESYPESLRDGREVIIDGERVGDVTSHPAFRNAARSIARLYDAMHDPEHRDRLVGTDRGAIVTHEFFKLAYTVTDLERSRDAIELWARMSFGFMGRTPEASFMATSARTRLSTLLSRRVLPLVRALRASRAVPQSRPDQSARRPQPATARGA
jgi:aromatic ring hydroxylase